MPTKLNWETICTDGITERICVPGGWIVRTYQEFEEMSACSMVFVSDPDHEWMTEDNDAD